MSFEDGLMCTLLCVLDAKEIIHEPDGTLLARQTEWDYVTLPDADLQELLARGWLELTDLPGGELRIDVSGAGRYRARKWEREQKKRGRVG